MRPTEDKYPLKDKLHYLQIITNPKKNSKLLLLILHKLQLDSRADAMYVQKYSNIEPYLSWLSLKLIMFKKT